MSDLVVEREADGAVVVVRLNRPDARNALTGAMLRGLGQVVLDAEADPATRVVVLTGTGDRAFCSGMDLSAYASGDDVGVGGGDDGEAFMRLLRGEVRVPLVGAANASAVAGGLELLLGCDLVVAAEGARFGLPEVRRGLLPGGGGTMLGTRVPLAIALELLLTGDPIDAERAERVGLVNAVVPADEVLPTALRLAERIATAGPLGVAAGKEVARLAVVDAAAAQARLVDHLAVVFGSADAREGAAAFVEKRDPVWQGR